MAIAHKQAGVTVNAGATEVTNVDLGGVRNVRLIIKNAGANAFATCKVQVRAEAGSTPADVDTTTFATLAAGVAKQLFIEGPVDILRIEASATGGSTADVHVLSGVAA